MLKAGAGTIRGRATDAATGQPIIGATLLIENTKLYDVSGLDGSFVIKNVPAGSYIIRISYVSFKTMTREVTVNNIEQIITLDLPLETDNDRQIAEVTVRAKRDGASDRTARDLERNALQVTNIVSGRTIELSPDLTVANVIQRVSGISIERNSNGDGQYAVLRGMDKRYNYTLVNGVKIPSPDNKYRYVPLDIFPAELLDRLEVYKALTPSMEGDAVGGAINMVMKDAPDRPTILANVSTGYSELFFNRPFTRYDTKNINSQSPYEQFGSQYSAKASDFNKASTTYSNQAPPPNILGSFAIGNRFLNRRFGVMLAGSLQNTYRGSNSLFFDGDVVDTLRGITLTKQRERQYSEHQIRYGLHAKMDFQVNETNKIQWFNAFINLTNQQVRDTKSTELGIGGYDPVLGNATLGYETRSRLTKQRIYNSTLQGTHQLTTALALNWSAVYSTATNAVPDQTSVPLLGIRKNFVEQRTTVNDGYRRWEHNTDQDLAGYLNVTLKTTLANVAVEWMAGGLYRDKQRTNFYNNYTLRPTNPFAQYGVDFTDYGQITWNIQNPLGSVASALNYDATEKTTSGYLQFRTTDQPLEITGGVRMEHTDQGYGMKFPIGEDRPTGSQVYTDVLPSLHFRYRPTPLTNWRLSYFRSLNRPGFSRLCPTALLTKNTRSGAIQTLSVPLPTMSICGTNFFRVRWSSLWWVYFTNTFRTPSNIRFRKMPSGGRIYTTGRAISAMLPISGWNWTLSNISGSGASKPIILIPIPASPRLNRSVFGTRRAICRPSPSTRRGRCMGSRHTWPTCRCSTKMPNTGSMGNWQPVIPAAASTPSRSLWITTCIRRGSFKWMPPPKSGSRAISCCL